MFRLHDSDSVRGWFPWRHRIITLRAVSRIWPIPWHLKVRYFFTGDTGMMSMED
jgi:hypothetical protein